MVKLSLSKSGLQKQRNELKLYKKLLPSLDLKRMQLTAEFNKARTQLAALEAHVETLTREIATQLPMLADTDFVLTNLIKVATVQIRQENVVGVKLSALDAADVTFSPPQYSLLAKPFWVDQLVVRLRQMAILQLQVQVGNARVRELGQAVRRITQRVNLFEKILIPNAKKNIQRIQIFLGDAERSAVVRSKLAKAMHQQERDMYAEEEA